MKPKLAFLMGFLSLFLFSFDVYASQLYGNIYDVNDFSLFKGCVMDVNATPPFHTVIRSGSYNVSLLPGCYEINVTCYRDGMLYGFSNALICLDEGSNRRYDFLIFPEIDNKEESEILLNEYRSYTDYPFNNTFIRIKWYYLFLLSIPPIVGIYFYIKRKKHQIVNDEYMKDLLDVLKKERRITQKELVKMLKLSDAKISLMLTELEREGLIKKIKKGRTNVIIYKG